MERREQIATRMLEELAKRVRLSASEKELAMRACEDAAELMLLAMAVPESARGSIEAERRHVEAQLANLSAGRQSAVNAAFWDAARVVLSKAVTAVFAVM